MTESQKSTLNEIIESFLCKDKRAKIPLKILQKPKKSGGLGLVNIDAKHSALLLNWIPRINKDEILLKLCQYYLGDMALQDHIWKYNLAVGDLKSIFPTLMRNIDSFWAQLISKWCSIHFFEPQNRMSVKQQFIRGNSHLRVTNSILSQNLCRRLESHGIVQIKDLVKDDDSILSIECLNNQGANINWLDYQMLVRAIPDFWPFVLRTPSLIDNHVDLFVRIAELNKISSLICAQMCNSNEALLSSASFWGPKVDCEWYIHENAFVNIGKVTNVVKLHDF